MVNEAEKYKDEDKKYQERVSAKNGLESYCFSIRSTLNDEKLKDKIDSGDREKVEKAVKDTLDWLNNNEEADKDEFSSKQSELEGICSPIMSKLYQGAGGGAGGPDMEGMGSGGEGNQYGGPPPSGSSSKKGPKIEEVD